MFTSQHRCQHTPPLQPPIPCTSPLYLSADAGKPAQILLRHTVVGLLKRHDPILYSCLKDKEQRHGACGLAVFLFPTKRTDQTSAPRLEDWVVPCGNDDSGRNPSTFTATVSLIPHAIRYNESGWFFHRLATPTDCPACQDGSQHGAAASLGEDTLIRIYERTTVHSWDHKTRLPVAAFPCRGAQSYLHHRQERHWQVFPTVQPGRNRIDRGRRLSVH